MRYIVSGVHRSGTSMMMKCLIDGGISPVWDQRREDGMRLNNREDYNLNPEGFWEVGQKNYMKYGFTSTLPDECCVKIQAIGLPILSGGAYKVIMMRRDPEAIKRSFIKGWGQKAWDNEKKYKDWPRYYHEIIDNVIDIMSHRDDVELMEIEYNHIVDNPYQAMQELKDFGIPINVETAAKVPKKEHRRNEAA